MLGAEEEHQKLLQPSVGPRPPLAREPGPQNLP